MEMTCAISGCTAEPYADMQWGGTLPTQQATFCEEHTKELWDKLNQLLQINHCWLRIDKPGMITNEDR